DVLDGGHQLLARDDPVDQVALHGALGGDRFAHQLQLHGHADPAGVHQPYDAAVGEMHAPSHVVEAELSVRGRDPDGAGQREVYAAAHYQAVQGGDDRLVDPVQSPGDPAGESLAEHVA